MDAPDMWARLRADGHKIGDPYMQEGRGMMAIIDEVAMPLRIARLVADKRVTVDEVAARLTSPRSIGRMGVGQMATWIVPRHPVNGRPIRPIMKVVPGEGVVSTYPPPALVVEIENLFGSFVDGDDFPTGLTRTEVEWPD
jgi:hypothetical protein